MDLLLDVNIILELCKSDAKIPAPELDELIAAPALKAVIRCQTLGGRIWLYAGSISTVQYKLAKEIISQSKAQGSELSRLEVERKTSQIIKQFAGDKHWLAALAPEDNLFDADNLEQEQLIRALNRFEPANIMLLTRDNNLIEKYGAAISPERYLNLNPLNPNVEYPPKSIDFIDLKTQQNKIRSTLEQNIHRILHHGSYIMGNEVAELEKKLAVYAGVKHCITASSGTDTLLIAMMALGICPGDEVITSPFTFIATGEMISLIGAVPVFVDIDSRTFNIDPSKIEKAVTQRTKAIMPVSLYGQCADFDAINAIADKYNIPVIEDGAQSFGATYKGKKSCALSLIGSTSFFPSKPLGAYGDGGALFTNDDELARTMSQIRVHGQERRYYHKRLGINGRLDTLQAGILLAKLEHFDQEVEARQTVALKYSELLEKYCPSLTLPYIETYNTSVFAQYTVLCNDRHLIDINGDREHSDDVSRTDDSTANYRDKLIDSIKKAGIPIAVHYPLPLHLQPVFNTLKIKDIWSNRERLEYKKGDFPVAEKSASEVFSLPMGPYLRREDQEIIVRTIAQVIDG